MSALFAGKHLRTLLILFVLFGLPALSWVFLQKGLNYRLKVMNELDSLGVAPVCLPLVPDSLTSPQSWKKETWLVAFVAEPSDTALVTLLKRVYDNLEEKTNLNVLLFRKGPAGMPPAALDEDKHWFEVVLNESGWKNLAVEGFHWPQDDSGELLPMMVALVDKEGVIINFYKLSDAEQLKKMVRHIAYI